MTTTIAKIYEALGGESSSTPWLVATGTISTSGDNPIIAAPGAGQRIVLGAVTFQSEATGAITILLKNGATVFHRLRCAQDGDGVSLVFPADARIKLGSNAAFVANLSVGGIAIGYTVRYFTEAV